MINVKFDIKQWFSVIKSIRWDFRYEFVTTSSSGKIKTNQNVIWKNKVVTLEYR